MPAVTSISSIPLPPGMGRSSSDSMVEKTIRRESEDRTNDVQDVGSGRNDEDFMVVDDGARVDDVAVQTFGQGTLVVAARAPPPSSLASRILKAGQHLQLPSFQSLGISISYPTNVLTPPEEHTGHDWKAGIGLTSIGFSKRSSRSCPLATKMPETPSTGDSAAQLSKEPQAEMTEIAASSPSLPQHSQTDIGDSSASQTNDFHADTPWLEQVAETTLSHLPSRLNMNGSRPVNILFNPQPSPVSQAVSGAPTVLTVIVESLQTRFQEASEDRFIEITYAVPAYSTFSQLPTSPVSTPNRPLTADTHDYFGMPRTVIFTKGAIASSHSESLRTAASNPGFQSCPQTLVAPSSIDISVLERFIPPSSAEEYSDLFKLGRPSALVDRLIELQPENGGLAFVYPTLSGAKAFHDNYLGPIIEPLLRGLVNLHGLTTTLAEELAELEAVSTLDEFGVLTLKVRQLLASLNRGGKAHFNLELARKESIQADHQVWVQWFNEQETPRFREVMNRYWQRGIRLPQDQYISAASLVRKITDGLADGKGGQQGSGIEVGVYVIKRTK